MVRQTKLLPQLDAQASTKQFLSDSGLETTLCFTEGRELPEFASFPLVFEEEGRQWLKEYYQQHIMIAQKYGLGFVLEAPTWRANPDWGSKLGYETPEALAQVNRDCIAFMSEVREELKPIVQEPMVVSGCIGPRGDGYVIDILMSPQEARLYHSPQIETFAALADCDLVSAYTLSYAAEATGRIVLAAKDHAVPVMISFTLEVNGSLPSGETLEEAINAVDAATDGYAAYFGINCAHPDHFQPVLTAAAPQEWAKRVRQVMCNASRKSHAELDACKELDAGDPAELAALHKGLLAAFPHINLFGGCCGTNEAHVEEICKAVT